VSARCREETVQAREARDREREEACAAAVWARAVAQEPEEVWELAAAVWVGWAERAQEQDPAGSVSVHHAALQHHIALASLAIRRGARAVELRWREDRVEKSEKIAGLSVLRRIPLAIMAEVAVIGITLAFSIYATKRRT
jgi:hypothetical protein